MSPNPPCIPTIGKHPETTHRKPSTHTVPPPVDGLCPRCAAGRLFDGYDGERFCVQCGYVQYGVPPAGSTAPDRLRADRIVVPHHNGEHRDIRIQLRETPGGYSGPRYETSCPFCGRQMDRVGGGVRSLNFRCRAGHTVQMRRVAGSPVYWW